jgi:hypothetical protein
VSLEPLSYFVEDATVYERRLGEAYPLTPFNLQLKIAQHERDAAFYVNADPERASKENAMAELLKGYLVTAEEDFSKK